MAAPRPTRRRCGKSECPRGAVGSAPGTGTFFAPTGSWSCGSC